ncbi:hypothetical protein ZEAMMB73_Zm00001d019370 [Zea mays]
MQAAM